ncbi:MAG: 3-oxoadipate enol-lactonase [Pseudomonadota bacterium]
MARLTRPGIRLFWREDGPQAGPALLFLNSLGTDLRLWDGVVARLQDTYRCIRMDTRGHGETGAPDGGPYDMAMLTEDAAAILDHLGLARVTPVGVSLGGMMAQNLAATRPKTVTRAVFSNTAPRMGSAQLWADRISAVRAGGIERIADAILDRWFAPEARHGPDMDHWRAMLTATPAQGYAGCCAALAAADLGAQIARITCPALVVAGAHDGASPPAQVKSFADSLANARYEEMGGVGHLPMAEAPDRFAALVRHFLETTHD